MIDIILEEIIISSWKLSSKSTNNHVMKNIYYHFFKRKHLAIYDCKATRFRYFRRVGKYIAQDKFLSNSTMNIIYETSFSMPISYFKIPFYDIIEILVFLKIWAQKTYRAGIDIRPSNDGSSDSSTKQMKIVHLWITYDSSWINTL